MLEELCVPKVSRKHDKAVEGLVHQKNREEWLELLMVKTVNNRGRNIS